ncbi:hypothetical protein F7725_021961, partial [Dissostichus mawsoni]
MSSFILFLLTKGFRPDDPSLLDEPRIKDIAKRHNKTPAQHRQEHACCPQVTTPQRIKENFQVHYIRCLFESLGLKGGVNTERNPFNAMYFLFDFKLSDEDMKTMMSFKERRAFKLEWANPGKLLNYFSAQYLEVLLNAAGCDGFGDCDHVPLDVEADQDLPQTCEQIRGQNRKTGRLLFRGPVSSDLTSDTGGPFASLQTVKVPQESNTVACCHDQRST